MAPERGLPSEIPHTVKNPNPLNANVKSTIAALDTAIEAGNRGQTVNKKEKNTVVEGAIAKAATADTTSAEKKTLPFGPHTSENAMRLTTLTGQLNLATAIKKPFRNGARRESKEEGSTPSTSTSTSNLSGFATKKSKGKEDSASAKKNEAQSDIFGLRDYNFSSSPIEKGTGKKKKAKKSKKKPIESENFYMELGNIQKSLSNLNKRRGLPTGLDLYGNITKAREEEGLSPAPKIMKNKFKKSLGTLKQESSSDEISPRTKTNTTRTPSEEPTTHRTPSEEPTATRKTSDEPTAPRTPSNETTAPKISSVEAEATAPKNPSNELPFKPENLSILAHERGIGVNTKNGIRTAVPNSLTIAAIHAPKRVGKKTMKKIIFNTEQKKILERKIRRAEEAARKGPSLLSKIWSLGLGMGHGDTRNTQHHIEYLKSKLQTLDNSIAKSQDQLDKKRAVAQNEATKKNIKAEQKALESTKNFRDLLIKYIKSEATGEIEVPHTQKNTAEINAIRKERAEKKTKKTNILAITNPTNPTNKRAVGLGENMKRLFNNTDAYGKKQPENTSTQLPKPVISNQPLIPKVNLAAKNTKRKAIVNSMKGKNPYKLLGIDPSTINKEDFNSVVKKTFDNLLRAKKPKNISNENHDKKLGELRQARDFLLNTNLRTGFNSRVVRKINPANKTRSNIAELLAKQRRESSAKPSNTTMAGPKFSNQIRQPTNTSVSSVSSTERNVSSALIFG
jgi:hypothetical protein